MADLFGFVTANWKELTAQQRQRYGQVYCGICRQIHRQASPAARLALSYDMAFLALLHMSLYEPQEQSGSARCMIHPLHPRPWTGNPCVEYAADMNIALAYYNALDDVEDEGKPAARLMANVLRPCLDPIRQRWPRQCDAMERSLASLSEMERRKEPNPDLPASCFGQLMAELMVMEEDLWADALRGLGFSLGRFIYLADAILDHRRDKRKGQYNPLLFQEEQEENWEEYLVLAMARCTEYYEKLPLVQDKALLDNILYSGVWVQYRGKRKKEAANG